MDWAPKSREENRERDLVIGHCSDGPTEGGRSYSKLEPTAAFDRVQTN